MSIKTIRKLLIAFILLSTALLFSAFCYEPSKRLLTRYDLALMIEEILANLEIQPSADPEIYHDLDAGQRQALFRALSMRLMAGYPDGNFRPEEPIRNLETVCYLQKLAKFLRKSRPEVHETRQLMRFFAYQSQPEIILSERLPAGSFPSELGEPGGFVEKVVFDNLLQALFSKSGNQSYVLRGRVVDALSGKGLQRAYVASGHQTAVTDETGKFSMEFRDTDRPDVELFAAAEGFMPVELKKDLRLSPKITFRLKPEKQNRQAKLR